MDLESARTVKQCIERATCDAYGEIEQTSSWLVCLEEVFSNLEEVEVLGEIVRFKKFDIVADAIVLAVVRKSKKDAKVTLDSIELLDGTRIQKLWLKAYLKYLN